MKLINIGFGNMVSETVANRLNDRDEDLAGDEELDDDE